MFLITRPEQLSNYVRSEYRRLNPEIVRHAEGFVQCEWNRNGGVKIHIYSRVFGPTDKGWYEFDSVPEAAEAFQSWVSEYERRMGDE